MKIRFVFAVVYLIAALISGSVAAYGAYEQQAYATLLGHISDPTGAGILEAKIIVISDETGLAHAVTADSSGNYRVELLAAGSYSMTVEALGFVSREQKGLVLRGGDELRVDIALSIASFSGPTVTEAPIKARTASHSSRQSGLSITLSPPADPIILAASIKIMITVKNTSNKGIEWWTWASHDTAYLAFDVLLTKDGHEPETTVFHRVIRRKRRPDDPPAALAGSFNVSTLEPGKSFNLTIDLKRLYQITEPGEYTLEVSRHAEGSKTTVHSNALTLQIAQ
jgi:hypothetical protein